MTMNCSARPSVLAKVRASAIALGLLIALAGVASGQDTADAAETGSGYAGITPWGGYLGNYVAPDGGRVYCMDPERDWPSGTTDAGGIVDSITTDWGGTLSADTLRKLNYALQNYGQTNDATQAAALNAYIYAYTSSGAQSGTSHATGSRYIDGNATVQASYDAIWVAAETYGAARRTGSASLTIAMSDTYEGSVTVSVTPADATGVLTVTGATITATGLTTADVHDGSVIAIHGAPGDSVTKYTVSAKASFTAMGGPGPNVTMFTTGNQQRTLRAGVNEPFSFDSATMTTDPISLQFEPVVTTQVSSAFVQPGDAFGDTLVAGVAEGSAPWRISSTGIAVSLLAQGTLYGPFAEQPAESAAPPSGAPVVGTDAVTLSGPGNYQSTSNLVAATAGFYTWVWSIDGAQQPSAAGQQLPNAYKFSDRFGRVAETQVAPMAVSAVSKSSATEAGFGSEVNDQLSVSLHSGVWLSQGGNPITARFEGSAYFVPGNTAPAVTEDVPATAQLLYSGSIDASAPGIYGTEHPAIAPREAGYVVWVWSLSPSSPTAAYFTDWSDQFGLPDETTRIAPTTVTTVATPTVVLGEASHDSAMVSGSIGPDALSLVFQAYRQVDGSHPVCDVTSLVFDSSERPVRVAGAGTYDSESTIFTTPGTYFWVETLLDEAGAVLSRGDCGAADESTVVTVAVLAHTGTVAPSWTVAIAPLAVGGAALGLIPLMWRRRSVSN